MNRLINFIKKNKFLLDSDSPTPSVKHLPNWYKTIPFITNEKRKKLDFKTSNRGNNLKSCSPFFDSLSAGYMVTLHTDIWFQKKSDGINIEWKYGKDPSPIEVRLQTYLPIPEEFLPGELSWLMNWSFKTPPGYSILITHPLNRIDLPFFTLSGIIDSDKFYHVKTGSYPFLLKKNFEGILEAGTPIMQIFPFKRENWTSEIEQYDKKKTFYQDLEITKTFKSFYKSFMHQKKSFK